MSKLNNQTFGQQPIILNVRRLPARLNVDQVAALIGCQPHDIPILVKQKLLTPLGKPPANGIRFFATCTLEEKMVNAKWLDAATKALNSHWRDQNLRRKSHLTKKEEPTQSPAQPTEPETIPSEGGAEG